MTPRSAGALSVVMAVAALASVPRPAAQASLAPGTGARVVVASAAGHSEPSDTSPVLGRLTYGTRVEIRARQGAWLQVPLPDDKRLGGLRAVGYIKATSVIVGDGSAPATTVTTSTLPIETKTRGGLTVAADSAGQTVWLPGVHSRVVPIAEPLPTLAAIVSSASLPRALMGDTVMPPSASADVTWTWAVAAGAPAPLVPGDRPEFSVFFGENSLSTPTRVAPMVVRLAAASTSSHLVVASARGRVDLATRDAADWPLASTMVQNAIPVSFISSSQTILTGRVTRPLEEGQYAVVLRPRAAAVAGADVLTDAGDGLAMATVFRFRIGR